jgi:hypothetical protein
MKAIKKAQNGAKTADSTAYFSKKVKSFKELAKGEKGNTEISKFNKRFFEIESGKAAGNQLRQDRKGEPGFDANGFPIKKKKAKSGATIAKAKDGKWIQKATASIKRRGTEGKCTPITKPGCTGKAKALAKTFKKIAKSNKKN